MITPTVHLNGSSRERLLQGYRDARSAILKAIEALQAAAPNARDYYPQGDGAFAVASREHAERLSALVKVQDELLSLMLSVSRSGGLPLSE